MGKAASAGLRHRWNAILAVVATLLILLGGSWSQLWDCDMSERQSTSRCPCTAAASHEGDVQPDAPTRAERPQCCARAQTPITVAMVATATPDSAHPIGVAASSVLLTVAPPPTGRRHVVRPRGPPPPRPPAYLTHQAFLL